ncbi:5954_t:CDS:2 [Ambispora leptoticha]|uniref:5954_t:CDS:1 n=1 Tax=Ambispora leptoticha TaxID=144679 RepID=A0A9N9DXA4_9GLOM|nr:5954_t:CDS:2 [Ambispora leptoticha]
MQLNRNAPTSKIVIENEKDAPVTVSFADENKQVVNVDKKIDIKKVTNPDTEIRHNEVIVSETFHIEDSKPKIIDDSELIPADLSAFRSKYQIEDLIFLGENIDESSGQKE